ncbi:MAG: hypothetical protein M3238_05920 [Actinomycetota bacterium]|nr:hypothetical protein [Actinomycetota bacterium]
MASSVLQRPGAGWSVIVGIALALVAAGSFVAFSLVARSAGVPPRPERIVPAPLAGSSPVITLGEPARPGAPERAPGDDADATVDLNEILAQDVGPPDVVLGTRIVAQPVQTVEEDTDRLVLRSHRSHDDGAGPQAGKRKPKWLGRRTAARGVHRGHPNSARAKQHDPPNGHAYGHHKNGRSHNAPPRAAPPGHGNNRGNGHASARGRGHSKHH